MRALLAVVAVALALSGCATTRTQREARLHSQEELNSVGLRCGLALGELFQDESEKRLLFLFRVGSTAQQRDCVGRWARENRLHLAVVEAINFPES